MKYKLTGTHTQPTKKLKVLLALAQATEQIKHRRFKLYCCDICKKLVGKMTIFLVFQPNEGKKLRYCTLYITQFKIRSPCSPPTRIYKVNNRTQKKIGSQCSRTSTYSAKKLYSNKFVKKWSRNSWTPQAHSENWGLLLWNIWAKLIPIENRQNVLVSFWLIFEKSKKISRFSLQLSE